MPDRARLWHAEREHHRQAASASRCGST